MRKGKGHSKTFSVLHAMYQFSQQSDQQRAFIPAVEHPANADRRAFQVERADGVLVEDASAMCAGVHDNGFQTADEFAAFMGCEE